MSWEVILPDGSCELFIHLGRDETWPAFCMVNLRLFMHLFIYSIHIYWAFSVPDTELLNQTLGIMKQAKYSVHTISPRIKTFFKAPEALVDTAQSKLWSLQPNSILNCLVEIMVTMNSGLSRTVLVSFNFIVFSIK